MQGTGLPLIVQLQMHMDTRDLLSFGFYEATEQQYSHSFVVISILQALHQWKILSQEITFFGHPQEATSQPLKLHHDIEAIQSHLIPLLILISYFQHICSYFLH